MPLKNISDEALEEEIGLYKPRSKFSKEAKQRLEEREAEQRRRKNESAASGKTRLTTDDKRLK